MIISRHVEGLPECSPGRMDRTMKLKIVIHREEDGRYSVAIPALPGCYSCGDTVDEARANIRAAAEGWLGANSDRNPFDGIEHSTELIEEVEL